MTSIFPNCAREADNEINPLTWESSYEIVLQLMEQHPNADVNEIGLDQLMNWIVALPDFADDPALANEGILQDILREWYEEQNPL